MFACLRSRRCSFQFLFASIFACAHVSYPLPFPGRRDAALRPHAPITRALAHVVTSSRSRTLRAFAPAMRCLDYSTKVYCVKILVGTSIFEIYVSSIANGEHAVSRKHFKAIADALRDGKPTEANCTNSAEYRARLGTWSWTVQRVANALASFNPRFNESRFKTACGDVN
jgi:hypothetical protein